MANNQNELGGMSTEMGMTQQGAATPAYGGVQDGAKPGPSPTSRDAFNIRTFGGGQQPSTPAPQQNGGGWGSQMWGNNNQGRQGQPQGMDLWALSSGQQQYGAPQPDRNAPPRSPYEQPGGYGGGGGPGFPTPGHQSPGDMAQTGAQNAVFGPGMDLPTWMGMNNDGGQRRSLAEYSQLMQPYYDMAQNAYQYGMDFNEQQRRWNIQSGWQQQMDQAQYGLSDRQQGLAEWQANEAASQWGQQFGWQQENDRFNQGLATRDQNLAELQNQQQYGLSQRGMDLQEMQNQQRYGLDYRDQVLRQQAQQQQVQQWQQQFGLDTQQQNYQQEMGRGQLALQGRGMTLQELQNSQRYGLDSSQQRLDEAFRQSQLSQQMGLSYQQLQQNASLQGRGMDITQQSNLATQAYQQQQLAQQAALQREQMALQREQATMQAYGRAQAPQAKFVRNW